AVDEVTTGRLRQVGPGHTLRIASRYPAALASTALPWNLLSSALRSLSPKTHCRQSSFGPQRPHAPVSSSAPHPEHLDCPAVPFWLRKTRAQERDHRGRARSAGAPPLPRGHRLF